MMNDSVKSLRNVTLIKHDNLRDDEHTHLYDIKHIKKRSVPLFAANIKAGLRVAYGTTKYSGNNTNYGDINYSYPTTNVRNTVDHASKIAPITSRTTASTVNDKLNNVEIINGVINALKGLLR